MCDPLVRCAHGNPGRSRAFYSCLNFKAPSHTPLWLFVLQFLDVSARLAAHESPVNYVTTLGRHVTGQRRGWRERLCVRERETPRGYFSYLKSTRERERLCVRERHWEVTWGLRKRESVCEREREKHWEVTWSLRERDGWCKPRYVTNKTDTRHDSLDANTNKNVSNNIFYFKPYHVYHDLSAPRGQNFLLRHYYRLYYYNNCNNITVIRILGC